uniref:Uncharacterized protein n=1 Tax=Avena sativa TaxID=4498 RepID=A0ACD5UTG5_AVESA
MAARDEIDWEIDWFDLFARSVLYLVYALCAGAVALIFYGGWLEITSGNPEYTATFTGVGGLDPAALKKRSDQAAAVSPVFDVALRIDNTLNKAGKRCIGKHSSVVVSYQDAVLGRGTILEFCAPTLGEGETTVTAWAMDVQMPRFLRNRLASELERGEATRRWTWRCGLPGAGAVC